MKYKIIIETLPKKIYLSQSEEDKGVKIKKKVKETWRHKNSTILIFRY